MRAAPGRDPGIQKPEQASDSDSAVFQFTIRHEAHERCGPAKLAEMKKQILVAKAWQAFRVLFPCAFLSLQSVVDRFSDASVSGCCQPLGRQHLPGTHSLRRRGPFQ